MPSSSLVSLYRASLLDRRFVVLDVYIVLGFLLVVGQLAYGAIWGTFPFNALLAGIFGCAGCSVLGAILRSQLSRANRLKSGQLLPEDKSIDLRVSQPLTPQRAMLDFIVSSLVLFFLVMALLG
ncbi:hypothetical protein H696_01703 [Fonticula alba]|uniref:Dolichyl-diphosphooligosaccharide--protein glycosyltransferase subunit OST2 n=1 Tax=Fonticula alba TaxID=691883 RepID=A0A058ZFQ6_FONAL|nr:hypothetical protein H696_01703 [Fonticula alba]KCV72307.1 hypothetical protein H696_01703 [Fonticula alba]|eukprot:XP_009493885.1 hypothetical protein H696_01703 [Fonticula alba]